MGAGKVTRQVEPAESEWKVLPGTGPVAHVAHPLSKSFPASTALKAFSQLGKRLPDQVRLILTGGGFVSLISPKSLEKLSEARSCQFLEDLEKWTQGHLSDEFHSSRTKLRHDVALGVDVYAKTRDKGQQPVGQFIYWVGQGDVLLVPKTFPVMEEESYLAGLEGAGFRMNQRVVKTQLGSTLLLACHDANAFHPRNRALVKRAKGPTFRSGAIDELDSLRSARGLKWALNSVHRIEEPRQVSKFATSYRHLHESGPGRISVVGAFGYGRHVKAQLPDLLQKMATGDGLTSTKVIIP